MGKPRMKHDKRMKMKEAAKKKGVTKRYRVTSNRTSEELLNFFSSQNILDTINSGSSKVSKRKTKKYVYPIHPKYGNDYLLSQRDKQHKYEIKDLYQRMWVPPPLTQGKTLELHDDIFTNGLSENAIDIAFRKIKKNFVNFLIWRIEGPNLVSILRETYGSFFDTECYLIYASTQYSHSSGPNVISRELKVQPEYHIHFWLGNSTTQEKAGVVAYKAVELDYYLGCTATQHREMQGNESSRFKSYFTKLGIKIYKGPMSSITLSSPTTALKLYKIHGKNVPIITQMPSVQWSYFDSKYCYLLSTEHFIYVWVGRASNRLEKLVAIKTSIIVTQNNSKQLIFVDDGYEKTLSDEQSKEFTDALPLAKRFFKPTEDDEEGDNGYKKIKLYRCSDASGKYRLIEIKPGPLYQSDLCSDDVFLLDHTVFGVWIWVGKRANEKERMEAMRNARGFVKKKKYPKETNVTRVIENTEPVEFKMLFTNWKDREENIGFIKGIINPVPKVRVTKYDAETMFERPALAAKCQLIDDGSGTIKKWIVRNKTIDNIPKERNSVFFSSHCYIVLYKYNDPEGEKHILYYWLGLNSCSDDQATAIVKTIEIDISYGHILPICRIVQGHETPHFLQIFRGKMRIFLGKGTDYDPTGKNLKTPSHYLMKIEGTTSYNTRAVQVELKSTVLNSNCCFMLRKASHYFVWCGSYSTGDNREMAKQFAGTDFALLLEGSESGDFWYTIGGKESYTTAKLKKEEPDNLPARLFYSTFGKNISKVEEILHYTQADLSPDDILLLDARSTIFMWTGAHTLKEQRMFIFEAASNFIATDPTLRNEYIPIQIVKQDNEPPTFTGFFENWDKNLWRDYKTFDEIRDNIEKDNGSIISGLKTKDDDDDFDDYIKYPIKVLTGPKETLPLAVDPLRKELHLTYDDFNSLTKMSYKEFKHLPFWKQQEIKKKVGLF